MYTHTLRLFVEKLPKHPGFSKLTPVDKARVNKLLNPAFERALELKKKLKVKFEQERDEHVKKMESEVSEQVLLHGCIIMYGIMDVYIAVLCCAKYTGCVCLTDH